MCTESKYNKAWKPHEQHEKTECNKNHTRYEAARLAFFMHKSSLQYLLTLEDVLKVATVSQGIKGKMSKNAVT